MLAGREADAVGQDDLRAVHDTVDEQREAEREKRESGRDQLVTARFHALFGPLALAPVDGRADHEEHDRAEQERPDARDRGEEFHRLVPHHRVDGSGDVEQLAGVETALDLVLPAGRHFELRPGEELEAADQREQERGHRGLDAAERSGLRPGPYQV